MATMPIGLPRSVSSGVRSRRFLSAPVNEARYTGLASSTQSASVRAATIFAVSSSRRSGGRPSAKPSRKSARLSSEAETPARADAASTASWMAELSRPGGVTAPTTATSRGIASGRRAVAVAAQDPGAHERDQLAAILLRVLEGVEAADEEGADAEVVVVEEGLGHLLGGAHQRGGIARAAHRRRDGGPEPLVVPLALARELHQPLRAHRLRQGQGAVALLGLHGGEDAARLVPGGVLGGGNDGPQRDADARLAPHPRARRAHLDDALADGGQRLAPQHVDVAVLGPVGVRGFRGAAEVERDVRLLDGLDLRERLGHVIELALEVEGPLLGPGPAQQDEILVGAAVTRVVVEPVAVLGLVGVAAAGDDVERHAPPGELIQRGRLARGQGGGHEAGPVGDEIAQALGVGGGVAGDEKALGGGGGVADQHLVEARALVGAREVPHPGGIDLAADDVDGGAVGAFGGEIDAAWVRDFSRA